MKKKKKVRDRINYDEKQRKSVLPETAKENPIHSKANQLKNNRNAIAKNATTT